MPTRMASRQVLKLSPMRCQALVRGDWCEKDAKGNVFIMFRRTVSDRETRRGKCICLYIRGTKGNYFIRAARQRLILRGAHCDHVKGFLTQWQSAWLHTVSPSANTEATCQAANTMCWRLIGVPPSPRISSTPFFLPVLLAGLLLCCHHLCYRIFKRGRETVLSFACKDKCCFIVHNSFLNKGLACFKRMHRLSCQCFSLKSPSV